MCRDVISEKSGSGAKRHWDRPAETADRRKFDGFAELLDHRRKLILPAAGADVPIHEIRAERDHLLRAEPAGNALAARFVAKEFHRVQRLLGHVATFRI